MMSFLQLAAYFVRALVTSMDLLKNGLQLFNAIYQKLTESRTEVCDLTRKMRYIC